MLGLAAPGGPVDPERLQAGQAQLHDAGFETYWRDDLLARDGYFAGDDARRAAELMELVNDPRVILAILCALTMVFSNVMNANAAAVLMFPIAVATAAELAPDGGLAVLPFAVAIMMGAAGSFATPIGYQTNLMVMGPGGYQFSDYLRVGVPLSLIFLAISVLLIPLVWPFQP